MTGWLDFVKHKSSFENLDEKEKQDALALSKFFTAVRHSVNLLMDCVIVGIAITFFFAFAIPNYVVFLFVGVWFVFRLQEYYRKLKGVKN